MFKVIAKQMVLSGEQYDTVTYTQTFNCILNKLKAEVKQWLQDEILKQGLDGFNGTITVIEETEKTIWTDKLYSFTIKKTVTPLIDII